MTQEFGLDPIGQSFDDDFQIDEPLAEEDETDIDELEEDEDDDDWTIADDE